MFGKNGVVGLTAGKEEEVKQSIMDWDVKEKGLNYVTFQNLHNLFKKVKLMIMIMRNAISKRALFPENLLRLEYLLN